MEAERDRGREGRKERSARARFSSFCCYFSSHPPIPTSTKLEDTYQRVGRTDETDDDRRREKKPGLRVVGVEEERKEGAI